MSLYFFIFENSSEIESIAGTETCYDQIIPDWTLKFVLNNIILNFNWIKINWNYLTFNFIKTNRLISYYFKGFNLIF